MCQDCVIADRKASCREPATKPVGKPDAGNGHVRFAEREGEADRANDTAPFNDSADRLISCFTTTVHQGPCASPAYRLEAVIIGRRLATFAGYAPGPC